jgi:hypothetical protein
VSESAELLPVDHYEKVNKIVELHVKGYTYTQIAKETGERRTDVIQYIDDWKSVVKNDPLIKNMALDTVHAAIEHYSSIKQRAWDVAERAKADDDKKVEISALTLAGNITKQEFEHLKAAGLLQDDDITSKIIEIEEQKQRVVGLLRTIAPQLCDKDRRLIAEELSKISGKVEQV